MVLWMTIQDRMSCVSDTLVIRCVKHSTHIVFDGRQHTAGASVINRSNRIQIAQHIIFKQLLHARYIEIEEPARAELEPQR